MQSVILVQWESLLLVTVDHCLLVSHISHDDRARQPYSRKYYVKWWSDFAHSDEDYRDWSFPLDRVVAVASWTLVYRLYPFWFVLPDHWLLIYTPQKGASQGATQYHRVHKYTHQNNSYSSWGYPSMLVRVYSYAMGEWERVYRIPKKGKYI